MPGAGLRGRARPDGDGTVTVDVNPSNCVQCGAITAKGGRLTPPEGGSGPEYTLTLITRAGRPRRARDDPRPRPPDAAPSPRRTLGEQVCLKAELFQKTGSFKPRGVLNKLASLSAGRARARRDRDLRRKPRAGARLGRRGRGDRLPRRDVGSGRARRRSPRPAATARRSTSRRPSPTAAFDRLDALLAETGRTLVHPFDDPVVLAGAGTVALEILEDAPEVETIVVPVGGGGLVAGIAAAAPGPARVAVEPERSAAVHDGLAAGKPVPVVPDSIADGLSAPFAGETALEILRAHGVESVLVTEEEIEEGFRFLYERAKLAVRAGRPPSGVARAPRREARSSGPTGPSLSQEATSRPETASAILGRP